VNASRLGLAGWVANQPDGTVEIAASGDRGKLDELKRIVMRGPDGAHVSAVDEVPVAEDLEFPFAVRR
jgi:acylphosphatase